MSKYFVDGQDLTDIADAIRTGLASTASLEFPDDFVTGIGNISGTTPTGEKTINVSANGTTTTDVTSYATAKVVAAVPNTYAAGDEGKVVSSGALVAQTSSSTTINGTFDTTLINSFAVNVSGGVTPTGTKQINVTTNGTTTTDVTAYASAEVIANVPASAVDSGTKSITSNGNNQDVVGYAAVNVNVPNTYSSGDEGKVVYNGELVSQASGSVNTNGTYDTTLISSFTVSVSGGSSDTLSERLNSTLQSFTYTGSATKILRDFMRDCKSIKTLVMNSVTEVQEYSFAGCDALESISFNSLATVGNYAFGWSPKLELFKLPSATTLGTYVLTGSVSTNGVVIVLPSATSLASDCFRAVKVNKADFGPGISALPNRCFYGTSANHTLNALILRRTSSIVTFGTSSIALSSPNVATVYVPSALLSSYQANSAWTTWINSRSGNAFATIEGSAYENYYADGTPIT